MSSVEAVSENTWREHKSNAETRLDQYKLDGRTDEKFLVRTLKAALNWLPEGGRDKLAEDILRAEDDSVIWKVFTNFRSAVLEAGEYTLSTE